MKGAKLFFYVGLGSLFFATAVQTCKDSNKDQRDYDPIKQDTEAKPGQGVRGYDYSKGEYIYYQKDVRPSNNNLSDEEIRILREKRSYNSDGSYIYTPGRRVKTKEREMQDYIDDNIDDIISNY